MKVGETICVSDLFSYTPANASLPFYFPQFQENDSFGYFQGEYQWYQGNPEGFFLTGVSPTSSAEEQPMLYWYVNNTLNGYIPVNVTINTNDCLYYVTIMADGEPLNYQWWGISEMNFIAVTPYINGVAVGEPQSVQTFDVYSDTSSVKPFFYAVSIPANTYAGKTVEFHVTTAYDEELLDEIGAFSLPMSGEFIIRDVSWATEGRSYTGSTMPVTKGKAWGTTGNPVVLNFVRPTSVTTNPSSIDLRVGKTYNLNNLKYTFNPATSSAAVNFSPEWTVGNYVEYMKVEKTNNGTILTALKEPPYAPVTVDGFAEDYAAVSVPVNITSVVSVTGITIPDANKNQVVWLGDVWQDAYLPLDGLYKITPTDATNQSVTWTSSDASVAVVDGHSNEFGEWYAVGKKAGKTTLTVKTVDGGKTASLNLEVRVHVTGIELKKASVTVKRGSNTNLSNYIKSVLPADAYDKSVTWAVEDTSTVVTIDQSFGTWQMKANRTGTTTLVVTSVDNPRVRAYLTVTVESSVTDITIPDANKNQVVWLGDVWQEAYLPLDDLYEITPKDATNQEVTWTTSDESIVSVYTGGNEFGEWYAVGNKVGKAVLTVTTVDGGKTATLNVEVRAHVSGIELKSESVKVNSGSTTNLSNYIKSVLPTDAYDKSVTWAVTDTSTVVTVSQSFGTWQMKANRAGFTYLKVTSVDNPDVSAFLTVTVESKVTGITVAEPNQILYIGESANLKYTIQPSDATNKGVTWTSSDASVVRIESNPNITTAVAQKVGTAVLTATTLDGGKTATINVEVRAHVESISLTTQSITVNRGTTTDLSKYIQSVLPANAYDKSVKWTSSNSAVVSISGSLAVANAIGSCRVTATSVDNPRATATLDITVEAAASGIYATNPVQTVWIGEDVDLSTYFVPADATSRIKSWTSSDASVVAISGGTTTAYRAVAQKSGTAVLTVTTDNGQKATIQVTVHAHVTGIELTTQSVTVNRGSTTGLAQYIKAILPTDAYDKSVTWAVNDTSTVVTVSKSNDGTWQMKANQVGFTTLRVTSVDNPQASAFLSVQVDSKVTGITVEEPNQILYIGEYANLDYTISPSDATNKNVTWTSSDNNIVKVEPTPTGYSAVAQKVGKATLTVTTADGGKTATINIDARAHVESISLTTQSITINRGNTVNLAQYIESVLPANAYDKSVTWTSGNPDIVSITGSSAVAKAIGSCRVTATSVDNPRASASLEIVVEAAADGINVNNPVQTVWIGEEIDLSYYFVPADATSNIKSWTSSDPSVVAISGNGTTTAYRAVAQKSGKAVLTVTTDNGQTATIQVTVRAHVEAIRLTVRSVRVNSGTTTNLDQFIDVILPEDAYDKSVTWAVTDTSTVVSVSRSNSGAWQMTANKVGTTTLQVTSVDNPQVSAILMVMVESVSKEIEAEEPEQTIWIGEEVNLNIVFDRPDATTAIASWTSSNPDVVSVTQTEDGTYRAVGVASGEATLTVTTDNGLTTTIDVTVHAHVEDMTTVVQEITILKDETISLSGYPSFQPADAYNKDVVWTSSDATIVSVSGSGTRWDATGLKCGTVTLTVRSLDNPDLIATIIVHVTVEIESFTVRYPEQTVSIGDEINLSYSITPEDAADQYVRWVCSDTLAIELVKTATDNSVRAFARRAGTYTITGTPDDWEHSATITVDVIDNNPLTGLTFDVSTVQMAETETDVAILAHPIPADAQFDIKRLYARVSDTSNMGTSWKYVDVAISPTPTNDVELVIKRAYSLGKVNVDVLYSNDDGISNTLGSITVNVGDVIPLSSGWNWVSTPSASYQSFAVENAGSIFGKELREIRSPKSLIYLDPSLGYFGDFNCLEANTMYKFNFASKPKEYVVYDVNGIGFSQYNVALPSNWTWLAYPYAYSYSLEELTSAGAFNNVSAGSQVVSQDAMAEYNGRQWVGSLETLTPSEGLMYYNPSSTSSISWPSYSKLGQKAESLGHAPRRRIAENGDAIVWDYDAHAFADVMAIVAVFDGLTFSDNCSVGAFVNGECRGKGVYKDGAFFIVVHGKPGDQISFILHDEMTGEWYNVHGGLSLSQSAGNMQNPVRFKVGDKTTSIDDLQLTDESNDNSTIYDFMGRKVSEPVGGLYIINGQKTLVK
ncbi:MAG: Ig-like domain-containing protein [Bacteroidaceae bacterium]|nr:Ig-like domain-containing protein [Bacteroidaceae bacterium]